MNQKADIITLSKKALDIILLVSIVGEMFFFPSGENLAGCLMTLFVWCVFRSFFFKKNVIVEHPFAFLSFLSVFLARYIPLPATLLEGKPITHGFNNALETFFWESVIFLVISMAFYAAVFNKKKHNNLIQRTLYKFHFFETNAVTLWVLGIIGVIVRIQQLSVSGNVEYGDVGNKFLAGLIYLQYAPILLLFPTLSGILYSKNGRVVVWVYMVAIFMLSFATNSRQQMIYPIFTAILLFFLFALKQNISIYKWISPARIVILSLLIVFGLNFFSDISLAMLYNRSIRKEISRRELFDKTVETLRNDELMSILRNNSLEDKSVLVSYGDGWDETYLDNFMLNRYGNLRVTDQALYHVDKIGFANEKMQLSFHDKIIAILPTPMINAFGFEVDKANLNYSPGDMLYATSTGRTVALGGFRVTSLVADSLAIFGYWCFPIVFVLFFFAFKLLDCFTFRTKNGITYSIVGLISVFEFLGLFRNSIGLGTLVTFILRGFWELCLTYYVVHTFSNTISKLFFKQSS